MHSISEFRGKYYFLSNFYESKITYKGIEYRSAEAAFQAQKCADESMKIKFSNLSASDAKHLGRKVKLVDNWDEIKVGIMHDIVFTKFSTNKFLLDALLDTGNILLIEGNDWGDKFWGMVHGKGENVLGKILMETRSVLRYEEATKCYRRKI